MASNFEIIERSNEDMVDEIKEMFEQCKPYLEKGYGIVYAVQSALGINPANNASWFKNLKKYCWEKGYTTDKISPTPSNKKSKFYYSISPFSNRFRVSRIINRERRYFGIVEGEAMAKLVVGELNKCNWDKSQFDRIKEQFGV